MVLKLQLAWESPGGLGKPRRAGSPPEFLILRSGVGSENLPFQLLPGDADAAVKVVNTEVGGDCAHGRVPCR